MVIKGSKTKRGTADEYLVIIRIYFDPKTKGNNLIVLEGVFMMDDD